MSDDLVKRLRDPFYTPSLKSHTEAAERIEKLEDENDNLKTQIYESVPKWKANDMQDRIEQLEAALQLIIEHPVDNSHQWQVACNEMRKVARKAMGVENE